MAVETRHREMDILFKLLRLPKSVRNISEVADIISNLIASMETGDVETVKKQIMEREAAESNLQ